MFVLQLRALDIQPVIHRGQQMWLLRDPQQLTDMQVICPRALAQLLPFLDGTRDLDGVHSDFSSYVGVEVEYDIVAGTIAQLDEACLLDNGRSRQARRAQLAAYHALPFRPPTLADVCYPAQPQPLSQALAAYGNGLTRNRHWQGRGIISPHIDYQRGGPVYAQVWEAAEEAVCQAELAIVLGTDHYGGPGYLTLTRQRYATPYGPIPTDQELVERLAEAAGPDRAFADELNHRQEHSVELSTVWLDYTRRAAGLDPCPVVPILTGSFHHYLSDRQRPSDDTRLDAILQSLRREIEGRRTLIVASVDFAHVGPAFGDGFYMDTLQRQELEQRDGRLLAAISRGDAEGFFDEIAVTEDRDRICGFSAIYMLLRVLGPTTGHQIAYQHCPADEEDHSLVSIGGVILE